MKKIWSRCAPAKAVGPGTGSSEIADTRGCGDPSFVCLCDRCGSRRTVRFDGVRTKPGHHDLGTEAPGQDACCSVFKDRGHRMLRRAGSADFHLRGPWAHQRLPARAHCAPLTRASPESGGRRDGVSIGSFSPSDGAGAPSAVVEL